MIELTPINGIRPFGCLYGKFLAKNRPGIFRRDQRDSEGRSCSVLGVSDPRSLAFGSSKADRKYSPLDGSGARTVKFAEKYLLPGTQHEVALFYKKSQGAAHKRGHDVGGRIAFKMLVGVVHGYQNFETGDNIILDRGIAPFVNSQSRSCVRIEKITDPFIDIGPGFFSLYLLGDIHELHGTGGGNYDFSMCHESVPKNKKKADPATVCFLLYWSGLVGAGYDMLIDSATATVRYHPDRPWNRFVRSCHQ